MILKKIFRKKLSLGIILSCLATTNIVYAERDLTKLDWNTEVKNGYESVGEDSIKIGDINIRNIDGQKFNFVASGENSDITVESFYIRNSDNNEIIFDAGNDVRIETNRDTYFYGDNTYTIKSGNSVIISGDPDYVTSNIVIDMKKMDIDTNYLRIDCLEGMEGDIYLNANNIKFGASDRYDSNYIYGDVKINLKSNNEDQNSYFVSDGKVDVCNSFKIMDDDNISNAIFNRGLVSRSFHDDDSLEYKGLTDIETDVIEIYDGYIGATYGILGEVEDCVKIGNENTKTLLITSNHNEEVEYKGRPHVSHGSDHIGEVDANGNAITLTNWMEYGTYISYLLAGNIMTNPDLTVEEAEQEYNKQFGVLAKDLVYGKDEFKGQKINIIGNRYGVLSTQNKSSIFQGDNITISGNKGIGIRPERVVYFGEREDLKSVLEKELYLIQNGEINYGLDDKSYEEHYTELQKELSGSVHLYDLDEAFLSFALVKHPELVDECEQGNYSVLQPYIDEYLDYLYGSGNNVLQNSGKMEIKGDKEVNIIANEEAINVTGVGDRSDDGANAKVDITSNDKDGTVTIYGNMKKGKQNGLESNMQPAENGEADGLKVYSVIYNYNGDINIEGANINVVSFNTLNGDLEEKDNEEYAAVMTRGGAKTTFNGTTNIISQGGIALYATNFEDNIKGESVIELKEGSHNILGDIIAGGDNTDVNGKNVGRIKIEGANNVINSKEILAANGGSVDISIKDGELSGRIDDYYQVKENDNGLNDTAFRNNKFYQDIKKGGKITIDMNEESVWHNKGQSFVSNVNLGGGTIDFGVIDTELEKGNSVNIENLSGNGNFKMYLNGEVIDSTSYKPSDMLYIQNVKLGINEDKANYTLTILGNDVLEYLDNGDKLRFATIDGENADKVEFKVNKIANKGIKDVNITVGSEDYDKSDIKTNEKYNGSDTTTLKPGNDYVDQEFDENSKNYYITKSENQENNPNDIGKTIINMSKVNYNNAVYMDTLNKRLGEARYIDEKEQQGMWIRMRHDRIGKDNDFRIMNTMYEIGYDEKQECNNGERRIGVAIDYMNGNSDYTGVGGNGEISRKGIWLYDTWLGEKGHYTDYVAKWGQLSNDFTLYRDGDKITGDFSNNVYSISAEYGYKKDIGNNWYFEPQVQLQYAKVTDTNYITSQESKVELDSINSLITRAGFRLGKDLDERNTAYIKADILHEFLGNQGVYAEDKTGSMDVTYENRGTWYDIGFGFATAISKASYAYLDFETSFGNDYKETYQINAGLQWSL